MKVGIIEHNYNFKHDLKPHHKEIKKPAPEKINLIRYSDLTRLAFGSQISQIKTTTTENPLQEVITSPIPGVEHAKEWPLNLNDLKKMFARFKDAQKHHGINENTTPMVSVYNMSQGGTRYLGAYNVLINRLIVDEGAVLFDMNETANVIDEALAHELYHCKRGLYFSRLSDKAIEKAIDTRIEEALSTQNLPIFEVIAGEKVPAFKPENIKLLLNEAKKSLDIDIDKSVVDKIHEDMTDYSPDSVKFFIRTLKRLMQVYEKNAAVAYEPGIKDNVFSLENLEKRIPESVYIKMKKFQGMSKPDVVKKFLHEKTHKLILMGYLTPKEIERAREQRKEIMKEHPIKEGSPEEAKLLSEFNEMLDTIEANFILETIGNDKVDNLNKFKIAEEYIYSTDEINARQHGLLHKMNLLKEKLKTAKDYAHYKIEKDIKQAETDYQLNETMIELKKLRKQQNESGQKSPEQQEKIKELTQKATELAKTAEYTVPKSLGKKNEQYIPFSYGDSYTI